MTDRDRARLVGVHPRLVAALEQVFDEMDAAHAPMTVLEGVRTAARQAALFALGRTLPGTIVTYKDGVTHRSQHQPHADGWGYAADAAFVGPQPFDPRHPWDVYIAAVEARGLLAGARWKMVDKPHAELPDTSKDRLA